MAGGRGLSAVGIGTFTGPTVTIGQTIRVDSAPSTIRIHNVRLEPPPPDTPGPAAVLKFDMLNDGLRSVTDVVIEVVIREQPSDPAVTPKQIVGPFTVGGQATIDAGYTVNYVMLLRNLASDCGCRAEVRVQSAHEVN